MTASNLARTGLLVMSLSIAGSAAQAAINSPFRAMAGSWIGGGTLSMADGQQERLRCRAAYDPAGGGEALRLNIRCASPSYNFDLAGDVQARGSAISGSWSEASRNASGSISGRAIGDHIEASAQGQNFAANLSLTTRGDRQSIVIRPAGTDVRAVSLTLARR
ncbi:hypothetical protein [Bradyrhizobium sp. ARR65]|uniref:hypothetical protein n=1 Tax=Bradyrhizobium sp. ARR65 TaxID=1040989 RepID=UPI0004675839|nr:hypothetical protein [Bradyrhizobium sp. ARR65]